MIPKTMSAAIAFLAYSAEELVFLSAGSGSMKYRCLDNGMEFNLRFAGEALVLVHGEYEIELDEAEFGALLDRMNEYENIRIGAVGCQMTARQVMHWNDGEVDSTNLAGATILAPCRVGEYCRCRDGAVVVEPGLPVVKENDLWTAIENEAFYRAYMEDEPAVCQD